jgi:hypothetical protein
LTTCRTLRFRHTVSDHDALGPAKVDFVEVQVRLVRHDVMNDAHDGTAHAIVEAFSRVGMNGTAHIFAGRGANRVVVGKVSADRHKRLPLVSHQMG